MGLGTSAGMAADIDRAALQRAFRSILAATAALNIVTDVTLDLDAVGQGVVGGYLKLRVAAMGPGLAQSWFNWIFLVPRVEPGRTPQRFRPRTEQAQLDAQGHPPAPGHLRLPQEQWHEDHEVGPMAHGLYGCACLVGVVAVGATGGYADSDLGVWEDLVSGISSRLKALITTPAIHPVLAVGDVICDISGYALSVVELKRVGGF